MSIFDSREEFLAALDGHYSTAQTNYYSCMSKESEAYTHYLAGEVLPCIFDILLCLGYLRAAIGWLAYQTSDNPYSADMIYFIADFAGVPVTWQSICEAWGKNDFEGRATTIAFIDRMRQLLWDEPFSAVFAAKPEEQEL